MFIGLLVLLLLLYVRLEDSGFLRGFDAFIARTTSLVVDLFGGGSHVVGAVIRSPEMEMRIGSDCTPIVPAIILVSALIVYPTSLRRIALGIVVGTVALWILNLVRTTSLFLIGSSWPVFFDTAHYLVWQPVMILTAIVVWLLWVERCANAS